MGWVKIDALIQAAINETYEPFTVAEVRAEVDSGRATAFVGEQSILICSLHKHHDIISGHGWLGAGNMAELIGQLRPKAERWAQDQGASEITLDGRMGWKKPLEKHGYGVESVTLRKVLK